METEESEGELGGGGGEKVVSRGSPQQNSLPDRFSLFVSKGDFRSFKMDSSGCQGNSVTVVTAMETLSVA